MAKIELVTTSTNLKNRLNELLISAGHEPFHAKAQDEAITIFRRAAPDLAVVDVCLSFKSGLDLAKEFLTENNEIRVVALTDIDLHSHRTLAIRSGVRDLLLKPFTDAEFLFTIEKYIEGKDAEVS